MTRLLLVILWFLCGSIVWQQQNIVRGIFGVRIAFQSNSQMTTFVCFLDNGRTLTHKRILSQDEFIHFAAGDWPSIYNPKRINYFEERNLQCGITTGWSSNLYKPSLKQEKFLHENYGIANIDGDFFLDTAFWKLLSDIQDPSWIANYKSLQ